MYFIKLFCPFHPGNAVDRCYRFISGGCCFFYVKLIGCQNRVRRGLLQRYNSNLFFFKYHQVLDGLFVEIILFLVQDNFISIPKTCFFKYNLSPPMLQRDEGREVDIDACKNMRL